MHPTHGLISSTAHSRPTTFLLLSDTRSVSTNSHAEFMYHHEQQNVVGSFHLHTSTFKGRVHNKLPLFYDFLYFVDRASCNDSW